MNYEVDGRNRANDLNESQSVVSCSAIGLSLQIDLARVGACIDAGAEIKPRPKW